jgi:integrase
VRGVLSSAYQWAKTLGLATSNPALASILPRAEPKKEALALSPIHLDLVLNASTHWALPVFLDVCADLGARRGEVLALRWSDSAEGIVRIGRSLSQTKKGLHFKEPKSAAGFRYVPIPEVTMAILERRRAEQAILRDHYGPLYRADLDLIFCEENGEPLKPNTVSAEVSRLCRKLKLPKGASLHTLRHTHASHLLANGEPLTEVSKRLGHSSPEVTARIYAHAIEGRGRELADAWDVIRKGLKNQQPSTPPRHHHGDPAVKQRETNSAELTQNQQFKPN